MFKNQFIFIKDIKLEFRQIVINFITDFIKEKEIKKTEINITTPKNFLKGKKREDLTPEEWKEVKNRIIEAAMSQIFKDQLKL